ncbi:MAG: tetraacyldisaccharide 4'-kinase [Fimbriimonadales bacterium]
MDWPGLWDSPAHGDRLKRAALLPASHLYALGWRLYLAWYALGFRKRHEPAVPVVCVGSISVGGTGKTPVTIAIGHLLQGAGLRVLVSCSGYGGTCPCAAVPPGKEADPRLVGDEAVLLREALPDASIIVCRNRVRMAKTVAGRSDVDVILMDDGFQHLPLARTLDLVVLDGARPFGNGRCLPAGPLREPKSGLRRASALLVVGDHTPPNLPPLPTFHVTRRPKELRSLDGTQRRELALLRGEKVLAVSAIGNPERFEQTLRDLGASVTSLRFGDHHDYSAADLDNLGRMTAVTTEKDAVKLRSLPGAPDLWVLREEVAFADERAVQNFLLTAIRGEARVE